MVANGGTLAPALREADYSEAVARNPSKVTNSAGWQQLLEEHIPDSLLARKHKQLLTSTRIEHMSFPLAPRDTESEISEETVDSEGGELEQLYTDALEAVREAGKASVSHLQRVLKVGYSRASRIMDMLEAQGIVAEADGSRPREVLDYENDDVPEIEMEPQAHGGSLMRKRAQPEYSDASDDDILDMFEDMGITITHIIKTRTERVVYYLAINERAVKDALELAYKIKGKLAPDPTPPPPGTQINFINNVNVLATVKNFEDDLKKQLLGYDTATKLPHQDV